MARPREFDETEVLDKALLQFWRTGYEATSMQDLIDATGIGRQSLYNPFGDKRALFLAALARYHHRTEAMLAPLAARDASVQDVRDYVDAAISLQKSAKCNGCLVVRSALELGAADPEIQQTVVQTGRQVRKALANAFSRAIERGELRTDRSGTDLADYVFTTLNGIAGLLGTGGDARKVQRVIELMFTTLDVAA